MIKMFLDLFQRKLFFGVTNLADGPQVIVIIIQIFSLHLETSITNIQLSFFYTFQAVAVDMVANIAGSAEHNIVSFLDLRIKTNLTVVVGSQSVAFLNTT